MVNEKLTSTSAPGALTNQPGSAAPDALTPIEPGPPIEPALSSPATSGAPSLRLVPGDSIQPNSPQEYFLEPPQFPVLRRLAAPVLLASLALAGVHAARGERPFPDTSANQKPQVTYTFPRQPHPHAQHQPSVALDDIRDQLRNIAREPNSGDTTLQGGTANIGRLEDTNESLAESDLSASDSDQTNGNSTEGNGIINAGTHTSSPAEEPNGSSSLQPNESSNQENQAPQPTRTRPEQAPSQRPTSTPNFRNELPTVENVSPVDELKSKYGITLELASDLPLEEWEQEGLNLEPTKADDNIKYIVARTILELAQDTHYGRVAIDILASKFSSMTIQRRVETDRPPEQGTFEEEFKGEVYATLYVPESDDTDATPLLEVVNGPEYNGLRRDGKLPSGLTPEQEVEIAVVEALARTYLYSNDPTALEFGNELFTDNPQPLDPHHPDFPDFVRRLLYRYSEDESDWIAGSAPVITTRLIALQRVIPSTYNSACSIGLFLCGAIDTLD